MPGVPSRPAVADPLGLDDADTHLGVAVIKVGVGAAIPLVAYQAVKVVSDPFEYRLGMISVALVAAVAVVLGLRAAAANAVTTGLVLWYGVFPDAGSFFVESQTVVVDLGMYAVSSGLVLVLIARIRSAARRERRARRALDRFVDEAPMGIAVFDSQLRVRRINPVMETISERPEQSHLGQPLSGLGTSADIAALEALMKTVLDSGVPVVRREVEVARTATGEERVAQISLLRLHRPPSDAAVAAIVEDVTDQRHAEQRIALLATSATLLAGAVSRHDAAKALVEAIGDSAAPHVVVGFREGDRLRVVAMAADGDGATAERWEGSTIDLASPSALARSCLTGTDVMRGLDGFRRPVPDVAAAPAALLEDDATLVVLPVLSRAADGAVGVLGFGWPAPCRLDHGDVDTMRTLATLFAGAVARIDAAERLAADTFRTALDAMLDDVTIGEAVRNSSGDIVDFVLTYVNPADADREVQPAEDLVGRRVATIHPSWKESGLLDAFARVVDTGVPWIEDEFRYHDHTDDGAPLDLVWRMQVVRFHDGYLAVSRDITEAVRLREEARRTEELLRQERVAVDLLQQAALPDVLDVTGVDLASDYVSATTESPVGGDWYDAFTTHDGRIGLVLGDVAGHGRASVLQMLQARSLIHALAMPGGPPGDVLADANRLLVGLWEARTFATCVYALLDPATGRLDVANAGHPSPLVVGRGRASRLDPAPGLPLGIVPSACYPVTTGHLAQDETLVLFSDGLVESRATPVDEGIDALLVALGPLSDLPSASLVERVVAGVPESDRNDDLCLLVVRRNGHPMP